MSSDASHLETPQAVTVTDRTQQTEFSLLDERYPIRNTLIAGQNWDTVVQGDIPYGSWIQMFSGSPANNIQAEACMGAIVTTSARLGRWSAIPIQMKEAEGDTVLLNEIVHHYKQPGWNFVNEAPLLVKTGLVTLGVDGQGIPMMNPTEALVRFVTTRLSPQRLLRPAPTASGK